VYLGAKSSDRRESNPLNGLAVAVSSFAVIRVAIVSV